MSHKNGLYTHRLKDNEEEQRFANAWAKWNRDGLTILASLLDQRPRGPTGVPDDWRGPQPPNPSDRDHVVAATLVQWLGSPVGQSFLEELGYTRVKP